MEALPRFRDAHRAHDGDPALNVWSWLGLLGAAFFILDGLRLRRNLAALPVVPLGAPSAAAEEAFILWLAPGAALAAPSLAGAIAYAEAEQLDVLDLLPQRWSTLPAMAYAQMVDTRRFRSSRLAFGYSAAQALLVKKAVLAAARLPEQAPPDAVGFLRAARRLKCYAPLSFGIAVAPGLARAVHSPRDRRALLNVLFHQLTPSVFAVQALAFGLVALCAWRGGTWGVAALAGFSAAPLLALVGSPLRATDLFPSAVLAWPLQVFDWFRVLFSGVPDVERRAAVEARRPAYAAELAQGTARFLGPRQPRCYLCEGERLKRIGPFSDLGQHKPGRFTLERCLDCGHLQQDPRLTLDGLGFYYRDFYDGLGEESLEVIFGLNPDAYFARARAVDGSPKRWLDVGGGFGHFCWAAREVFPQTRFECLDMGASVEEASRRGWADASHRGLLPELASKLASQFDVVSLLHCLEHNPDPRVELSAAAEVLTPDGRLLVEVPDPECVWRKLLGPLWMPYFQPQHLHLLSVKNLSRLLEENGFAVERVERSKLGDNFTLALLLLMNWIDREDNPWTPPRGRAQAFAGSALRFVATPLFIVSWLVDRAVRVLGFIPHSSNAFRILARKR